jgi:hypothetical protein
MMMADYKYPTKEEIAADVQMESTAIAVAISAMADTLEKCPLKDHFKVYAIIGLAFKLADADYIQDVVDEIKIIGV